MVCSVQYVSTMNYYKTCFLCLLGVLLLCGKGSAYYNKSYDGYNLAIRADLGNQNLWATLTGAQDWCRTHLNGSSLASVTDSDHQTNIMQFANDAISAGALTENDIILNAQLELSDWQWVNKQNLREDADVQGQVTESQYLLYAYILTRNYKLMASKPADKRSYLCQYLDDLSNCSGSGFMFQSRCYRKYDDPKVSWFEARINCQREGGDLASFEYLNRDTLSTLNSSALYPSTSTVTDYWIGLKRPKWKWLNTDGFRTEVNFTYWVDGRPSDFNKKCICLGPRNVNNFKWIECGCNENHQFICLTVVGQTTNFPSGSLTIRVSTPATISLPSAALNPSASSSSSPPPPSSTSPSASNTQVLESGQQPKPDLEQALSIGLGVGLGAGIPLVILLAIVVALVIRKCKRNHVASNKFKPPLVSESSLESPQIEQQNAGEEIIPKKDQTNAIYALIQQQEGDHHQTTDAKEQQPVVYDKIEHVNQS